MIEAGHRLNLITATFLPITALGTVLGMNLVHGLEAWHQPYTFWIVAAVAIVVGLVVRASLPKPSATPPA
jgi:Mg2+ and Co2+ transporter CorA